jgi:hypothetical protein
MRLVDAPKGDIIAEIEQDARIEFQRSSSQRYLPSFILRALQLLGTGHTN